MMRSSSAYSRKRILNRFLNHEKEEKDLIILLVFFTISRWSLYRIHRLHVASKVLYVSIATIAQHPQRLQLAIT